MSGTLSKYGWPRSTLLVFGQFRRCGCLYALRKFLAITLLCKLSDHLAVAHSLSLPRTRKLAQLHPRSAFKYLHKYLARSFDIRSRCAILSNHYRYLNSHVRPDFIGRICSGKIPLWQGEAEGNNYGIGLTYPKNEEGELLLVFSENDVAVFTLSFTIAPGSVLDLPDEQVVFIGRLQGAIDGKEAIRRAAKSFLDVAPAALLLDAVSAIAASLNISGIVGVSAANQICLRDRRRNTATCVYDEFWMSAGASPIGGLGYYLPTNREKKALSTIKNNHRSRVKHKRQFRDELANQASLAFDRQCIAAVHLPPLATSGAMIGGYCGTWAEMNALSFATSASITSQR